jgi:hypothetical protein
LVSGKQVPITYDMQDHSIAGIGINIQGPRSPVTDAVLEMFRLTRPSRLPEKVSLTIYDLKGFDGLDSILPPWLCEKLRHLVPSEDAFMVYGPDGDLATIINSGAARYCAWMAKGATEIRYLSCKMTGERTPLSVSSVLVPVLRELVAAHDRVLLHAASLCCPDQTGIMVLADSGGGKTTTALSMLRQGAQFLADDLTVLHESTEQVHMTGFPELLNLTAQTIRFFPELQGAADETNQQVATGKRIVSVKKIYGDHCVVAASRLHVAYVVRVTSDGPAVKPVSVSSALGKLIHAHTFARNQSMAKPTVAHLFSFLSRIRTYELLTGPDPVLLGKWLIQNCHQHAAAPLDPQP